MAQTALVGGAAVTSVFSTGTTVFGPFLGDSGLQTGATSEVFAQTKNRGASTLQALTAYQSASSGLTATITSRVATAAGNQSITTTLTPGVYQDATHIDSLADGALYNYRAVVAAGSGSPGISSITAQLVVAGQCFTQIGGAGSVASTLSATRWFGFAGVLTQNTTETVAQGAAMESATLSNLQCYTSAGAQAATLTSRVATAPGQQTISVNTTTGFFEDTTHSDSITVGQLIDAQSVNGTAAKTYKFVGCKYQSATAGNGLAVAGGKTLAGPGSAVQWPFGEMATSGAGGAIYVASMAATASNTTVRLTANTIGTNQNWQFRINSANGLQVAVMTASTPGIFTDSTHTDSLTANALINFATAATFTSSATVASAGVLLNSGSNNVTALGTNVTSGSASGVITTVADAPVGSLIFVASAIEWASGASTLSSVADQASNTYATTVNETDSGDFVSAGATFSVPTANDLPLGDTITATYGNASLEKLLAAFAISGISAVDINGAASQGSSTSPSGSTGVLAQASETIVAVLAWYTNSGVVSVEATGWTPLRTLQGSDISLHVATISVNATTSVTYAPTLSATKHWALLLYSFKTGSGPVTAVTNLLMLLGIGT